MSDIHARPPILLFLKAVSKKQILIPGYTKRNGTVVAPHYQWVNVSSEHDEHAVVAGKGTVSQKKAHEKLSKHPWWEGATHEHKLAHVLHESTKIADEKYITDQLSRLKHNITKGKKVLTGEWKVYQAVGADKRKPIDDAIKAAGKWDSFQESFAAWEKANPKAEEPAQAAAEPAVKPELTPDPKPEPEPAPQSEADEVEATYQSSDSTESQASETASAGLTVPEFQEGKTKTGVKAYYEKVAKKIIDAADAGDAQTLLAMHKPETGNTWKGKTANSKNILELYHAALKQVNGNAPAFESAPDDIPDDAPKAKTEPAIPADLTAGYRHAAKEVKGWADKGNLEELVKMANLEITVPSEGMQALKDYAAALYEHKTGKKAEGVTPEVPAAAAPASEATSVEPIKPPNSMFTNAVNKIEQAYKNKDANNETLQQWAKFDAKGDVDFQTVVDYAKKVTAALGGTVAAAGTGPKEGDTKQGEHGMLVLKDGHWVRVDEEKAAPKKPSVPPEILAGSVPLPKFPNGHNKIKMTKTAKELKAIAIQHGVEGLKLVVTVNAAGTTKINIPSAKIYWGGLNSENGLLLAAYAKDLIAKMEGSAGTGQATAAVAPKKASPKATGSTVTETESVDGWKQVGPQGGYNPGGTYEDASGQKWYVKFPAGGEKIAKNELLATKLYALAGIEVPEVKLINQGGKIGLASKIVDGAVANKSALLEGKAPGLLSGFAADAWLANWDAVGNNPAAGKGFDNILFKPDGSAVRIDAGGALLYGGAGGKKQAFENDVIELKTMLDPAKNANTAAVFGKMSAADIAASVAKIAALPDHEIEGVVMEFGPGSASEKTRLAEKLIARKHSMSEQYPTAKAKAEKAKAEKKAKPDPTALPVDAGALPKPHDFMDWQGTGKPISEKPYVKGNIADEQEILNLALQGNLIALKAYKFQPVDKMTGEAVGAKKSIEDHPSKYVQDFHNTVVSYLDMLANPPEELRPMTAKKASTLASLSAAFKPHDFGMTTAKAPKNQQVGFWIALGVAETPEKFAPPAKELSAAAIEKANANHSNLPQKVKSFISGVQGSGSYNNPYRDGLDKDHGGNNTREVLTALYANATAHEAGTTIHKWINFAPEMVKQFMDAPDGLVFQNPGSMCTSYSPTGTKGFGKDRISIRYADGAKALDSFASGSFKTEMEVTTLPGARFMVLSRKMVADTEHGKSKEQRFELELLMLPPDPTYVDNLTKKA